MNSADVKAGPSLGIRCPACQAMNAANRRTCDLCGTSLALPEPKEVSGGRACPNCHAPLSDGAAVCAKCGRVQAPQLREPIPLLAENSVSSASMPVTDLPLAFERASRGMPPVDFDVEPLADGRICLRRTGWGRLNSDASGLLIALFIGMAILRFLAFPARRTVGVSPVFPVVLLVLVAGAGIVWAVFLREEFIVGPNFLMQRFRLFGYEWHKTIQDSAVLRIATTEYGWWSRGGARTIRTLYAQNLGRSIRLISQTRHHSGGLFGMSDGLMGEDKPGQLADYLALQTGWPVADAHRGR